MANKKPTPMSGEVLFVPLNKLKKSPKNVRKTPHTNADIEALAASIAANGLLQNLVVEPEQDKKGKATGHYLVNAGEGRRLAQLLRVKRKEIANDEPIRCLIDTEHSAEEISLAENTIRSDMHPADQYEAFRTLHDEQDMAVEDIAARFGVTPTVVKQRLKLAAVSPKLIEVYRDGQISLEELTAFTITDDHAKQERVWEQLSDYQRDRRGILHALREGQVSAGDRRAVFVGLDAYEAAGGAIARDLFDPENGGYLADADLLNRLVREKLQTIAQQVVAEGWKWVTVEPEFDYQLSAGMRRLRPAQPSLTEEQQAQVEELQDKYDALLGEGNAAQDFDEPSEDIEAQLQAIEAEIIAITGGERYRPEDIAIAGAFVALGCEGEARIERGFVRKEDEAANGAHADGEHDPQGDNANGDGGTASLSEKLIAELTAHRTAALRNELAQRPLTALTALAHALAAATFYGHPSESSCLEVTCRNSSLSTHAHGIAESRAERQTAERHEDWRKRMPEAPDALWQFVTSLENRDFMDLLAHCVSLSVNAVQLRGSSPAALQQAAALASAVALDMTAYWQPSAANYFSRVSKERILEAVREGVSVEAAQNIASLKKQQMAEAAEKRLAGKGWLPALLRTPKPSSEEEPS